jgi:hypothetical protein
MKEDAEEIVYDSIKDIMGGYYRCLCVNMTQMS